MIQSQTYQDPELGVVKIVARRNSMRMSARWSAGSLLVNIPAHISIAELQQAIERMRPRLLAMKPKPWLYDGVVIGPPDLAILVERSNTLPPRAIQARISGGKSILSVGMEVDYANQTAQKNIIDMLKQMARHRCGQVLPDVADAVAADVAALERAAGRRLRNFRFVSGNGFGRLGSCYPDGKISLSYALMFLPAELRDYVIRHELAHLTEMNHGPRFYALLDYYTRGRNEALHAALKAFKFPFPR